MDKPPKVSFGSKISKWQNNCMERHPAFFYGMIEVVAELIIALVLALFAFHMLPPELICTVSKKTNYSSVVSITNDGFLYASGTYGIESKKSFKKDPEILKGKQYVDSLERRSVKNFRLELSGLPYKKEIKLEVRSDNIIVEEE